MKGDSDRDNDEPAAGTPSDTDDALGEIDGSVWLDVVLGGW